MSAEVSVQDLCKEYGPVKAVTNLNISVEGGSALGIVGESGSGKTTVARMIAGLEQPDSGEIKIGGAVLERAPLPRAKMVQMVFQDPYLSLDPRMSASVLLERVLRLHGVTSAQERDARVAELLESVRLSRREGSALPRELSGGQRQRIALARALAVNPQVLVMDEATSALDVSVQAQILELLATIRSEHDITIIFVSHDLAVVSALCDSVAVMYRGQLVERLPANNLFSAQHPYTRLLLDSIPRPGWDPSSIAHRRLELAASMGIQ